MKQRKKKAPGAEQLPSYNDRQIDSPESLYLPGADRSMIDKKTNAAVPDDAAVSRMRDWSQENRL